MSDYLSSVAVPCHRCGASLPVVPGARPTPCRYCGALVELAADQLERLNRHLAELQLADAEARKYQEGSGILQASSRRRGLYFLAFLGPAFAIPLACWALERFAGIRYRVSIMGTSHKLLELVVMAAPLASAAAGGLLMLFDVAAAKRRATGLSRQVVGACRCAPCGATVPVVLGRASTCPFCGAGLAPGRDASQRIEAAAGAQVAHHYGEYVRQLPHHTSQVGWPKKEEGFGGLSPTAVAVLSVGSVVLMSVVALIAWLVNN